MNGWHVLAAIKRSNESHQDWPQIYVKSVHMLAKILGVAPTQCIIMHFTKDYPAISGKIKNLAGWETARGGGMTSCN